MQIWVDSALFIVAGLASMVDTIAGGGGLMVVPALLLSGLSPAMALGTNKFQATFGCGMSAGMFVRAGKISWEDMRIGVYCSFVGASIGTLAILHMHPDFLKKIIPIVVLLVLIYMLSFKDAGHIERKSRMRYPVFMLVFGSLLGFYDGFFGPGTGSFWVALMVALLGWDIKKATMHAKIYNFTSNFISLLWFITFGHIHYGLGLLLAVSSVLGAKIGAKLVMTKTTRFIKPIYIIIVLILFISLMKVNFF